MEPDLRVSDADRERAATELREHYAQGRLDGDELAERLGRAYGARTAAELDAVRTDLPAVTTQPARSQDAERRAQLTRRLVQNTGAGLIPFVVCTVIWLLAGASGSFWPAWLLLIAVVPLLRSGWHLYGPAPDLDRAERELEQNRPGAAASSAPPPPP